MAGADQRWQDEPSGEAERYLEAVTAELKGVGALSGLRRFVLRLSAGGDGNRGGGGELQRAQEETAHR